MIGKARGHSRSLWPICFHSFSSFAQGFVFPASSVRAPSSPTQKPTFFTWSPLPPYAGWGKHSIYFFSNANKNYLHGYSFSSIAHRSFKQPTHKLNFGEQGRFRNKDPRVQLLFGEADAVSRRSPHCCVCFRGAWRQSRGKNEDTFERVYDSG